MPSKTTATMDVPNSLLTFKEMMAYLKVGRSSLCNLLAAQDPIPSVKIGHNRRFVPSRVEAWLDKKATEPWVKRDW